MKGKSNVSKWGCLALALLAGASPGIAEVSKAEKAEEAVEVGLEAPPREPVEPAKVFDSLVVTGGAEAVESIPGSAVFISAEEMERQDYSDIHRVLRSVPGVNIQEEDGYGLRPNIGMRGTGVERSAKITLLEDGVLAAPAPYAAPAAYYFPTAGRMEAVEVRKGSSSIGQGPYTNGGVINLVSLGIPDSFASDVRFAFGDNDTFRLNADVGSSAERFGWMFQTYQLESGGFKDLDGGGSTGVSLSDYLGKLRFGTSVDAERYQALELKLGRTDQLGDETYLGLTAADFSRTPYRRYAASQRDVIDAEHETYQLRYYSQPTSRLQLTTTAYRNDFFRNWHKGQSVNGVGLSAVVDSPELFPNELAVLRGEVDDRTGAIRIRNNRRNYVSEGIDLNGEFGLSTGSLDHDLRFGVRMHSDREDRFQDEESWNMVGGFMEGRVLDAPGSQSNRVSSADALAYFIRDEIRVGRFTLSPGVRFETIDFKREDFGGEDPSRVGTNLSVRDNDVSELLPGVGLSYELSPDWSLFGGVHKGFAPPGPGQSDAVENEESVNYELGFNFRDAGLGARVVGFWSDYDNLLGRDTLSVGGEGTGDAFNGGEVEVRGVEVQLDHDLGRSRGLSASLPVRLSYTYTSAEFQTSFETSFADWAPLVEAGDRVPYIPEHQLTAAAGYVVERWAAHLNLNFVEDMRTRPGQGAIAAGTEIESRLLADLSIDYKLRKNFSLTAQIRNLTDEVYLVGRRPHGARPGLPRTALFGIEWTRRK